jgi:hypothetical protein
MLSVTVLYFLEYHAHLKKNIGQKVGCTAYSHSDIGDMAVFHETMISLLFYNTQPMASVTSPSNLAFPSEASKLL